MSSLLRVLRVRVVLLIVDVVRGGVLFLVDLFLFALRQLAAVGGAIRLHLLVDAALLIFELRGFAGGQLAALDTLGDAILLVFATLGDLVGAVVRGRAVVLVVVDLLGKLLLLPVDLLFFRRGQRTAVGGAIRAGFAVDRRFLRFEIGGFPGRQLAAFYTLRDAVLLIFLALPDVWI